MTFARSFSSGLGLLALIGAPLVAQSKRPATWKIVLDRPAADSVRELSTMPPGWHITTGPGALFFDPVWQVGTADTLHVEIFLFPDSGPEEYGVFLSSESPEGGLSGLVVALRRDGQLAAFRRSGAQSETLLPWQAHASINALPANPEGPVKNVIRLEPAGGGMNVVVNGAVVAKVPGATGQTGLRVGAGMNLHVSKFEIR